MNKISIIVPCFNEEEVLPAFYQETKKVMRTIPNTAYEFVFVDDGSKDHTIDILRLLSYQDSRCKYISFSRNFGKEAAMYAGLSEATGDYCVLMDADLQHPPALLPGMYRAVSAEGYDCCAGKRVGREGDGVLRSLLSKGFYCVIQKLTHMNMSDGDGDFRMMNRKMVNAILEMKEYNRYTKGIFSFVGFETKWLEFHNVERAAGKTKWNIKSLFSYAFDGILSFSTAPLKISGILGLVFLLLSAGLGITAALHPKTWLAVIAVVMLLSSLQMLMVFILGEYLSKDYLENKKRPIFIVREESTSVQPTASISSGNISEFKKAVQ